MYSEGDIVPFEKREEATEWVNSHQQGFYLKDFELDDSGKMQLIVCQIPAPSPEEVEAKALEKAKAERLANIQKTTVEVDGMIFNADLTALQLMSATLSIAMANQVDFKTTKLPWVLAEDKWTEVTIETLAKVAMQAGLSLAEEWVKPYPRKEENHVAVH